ncbi:unnamed protein product [Rotaria socialis]|uniref:Ammonium transporter n=2 Tax=Rotaria socialis TaxID=392032 RepID=A0A820ZWU9_9BILA|nr:unnamed protein product [Rotaria socialis]
MRAPQIQQLMTSTGLVYLMTPALACFYGGLVENKNFLNQLFLSIVCMAIIPVQWCLFGYSFAFGPGNSVFGSFQYALLSPMAMVNSNGENIDKSNVASVTSLAFVAFQCSFATITPALISGAVVGRMKIIQYMIFIFLWTTVCYAPLARWIVFNGGWLNKMGVMDFSGGLIVHLSSGISGLVAAIILGSRFQFDPDAANIGQTNLAFTILGTGLLWVGWMGFTGGAAFAADGIAALAIVNTNIGAASSMTTWSILDIINGKLRGHNSGFVSIPGLCSASIVGLVVVTPAAGFIQPCYALAMGFIGGVIVYSFLACKRRFFHIDDTLDVFSCHGLGGMVGTCLTGLFCQKDVNEQGNNGALYGNPAQFLHQLIGILVTGIYAGVCTAIILLSLHFTIGIRIHQVDQARGLDNIAHGVIEQRPSQDIKMPSMQKRRQPSNVIATINIEHE